MYEKYIKRILDINLSLIAIILLSPLFIIIAILIKIDSKGTAFFLQERLGKNGKVFKIIKFRTMKKDAEKEGINVSGKEDIRITRIGNVLRKTSIDELPQVFNIIKGDMSIVGPRPPVTYHPYKYEDYNEIQKKRFCVRPGMTGLAQVKVRNSVAWEDRIKIDIEYVENITFINDCKIILKTIIRVIKRDNIYKNT